MTRHYADSHDQEIAREAGAIGASSISRATGTGHPAADIHRHAEHGRAALSPPRAGDADEIGNDDVRGTTHEIARNYT